MLNLGLGLGLAPARSAAFTAGDVVGGLADVAWSWWSLDPAVPSPDQRYLVMSAVDGTGDPLAAADQDVVEIDRATGEIAATFTVYAANLRDDHITMGLRFFADGSLGVLYCGHDDDGVVRFRRSPTGRVAAFGEEVTVLTIANQSYAQLFQDGDGRLWAMSQNDDTEWAIAYSDDMGASWTRGKNLWVTAGLATTDQGYQFAVQPAPDLLRIFCIGHPSNVQNALRVVELDLSTGTLSDESGALGTVFDGTNDTAIVSLGDLPALLTPGASHSQRLLHVRVDGDAVLLADFVTADGSSPSYVVLVKTGADWHTAAHWTARTGPVAPGTPFYAASKYFAGACFDGADPEAIFFAYQDWDGLHKIRRFATTDAWATSAGDPLAAVSANRLVRPLSPTGISAGVGRLLYQEVIGYTDFTDWAIDAHWTPGTYVAVGRAIESEAQAFLDELDVQPNERVLDYLNEAVHSLKNGPLSGGSVWSLGHRLLLGAWPTAQGSNVDLFHPTATLASIASGAPAHTPYLGWTYDGDDDARDHGINLNTAPQNAAVMGVGSARQAADESGVTPYGWSNGSGQTAIVLNPLNLTGNIVYRVNTGTSSNQSGQTDGRGNFAIGRTGASAGWMRKNRQQLQTFSTASTTPPDHNSYGGTVNMSAFGAGVEVWWGLFGYASANAQLDLELPIHILAAQLRSEAP